MVNNTDAEGRLTLADALVYACNQGVEKPKPKIDYTLKAVGGSLTAIPGLSDMIDLCFFCQIGWDTMDSIVTDMLQWPHRIVVPIGGIAVDTSELELRPQGKLTVTVVKANDLKNMEMIGKSYPYVVVYIRPLFKVKTKVIDNDLNPIWNQTFELIAEDKETQSLILEGMWVEAIAPGSDGLDYPSPSPS
ncbi:Synaptotagmin-4 [Camellia lanceoleosa]|uniref:Synaptotagmin-4 n=1 Tax=Camellia lanceoleosa TaxID=1840588 RepID=A0ACC0G2M6_9ERIC|nr:Synaptotagmin-4 [Camellia lanceoleosa]